MKESRRNEGTGRWPLFAASVMVVIFGLLFWRVRGDVKIFDTVHIWTLIIALGISMMAGYVAWDWDTVAGALKARGTLRTAGALVQIGLVAALLVFINYFSSRNYKKWDLTEEQAHTLAQQSVDVAKGLANEVQVLAFFKSGQPEKDKFRETVELYTEVTPKISVRFVDPDADPVTTKAYNIGMAGTVIMESGDRKQTLSGTDEQDITRGLIKITREAEKTVCFTTGHGERDLESSEGSGLSSIKGELTGQGYQSRTINIAANQGVDPKCSVIVIAGPAKAFDDAEIGFIETFIQNQAGGVIALLDPQTPDQHELLRRFNVKARTDVIVDANPINQVTGQNFLAPIADSYGKHAISEKMSNVQTIFPLARSLEVVVGTSDTDPNAMATPLVFSSEDAWGETNLTKGVQPRPDKGQDAEGPLKLMIAGYKLVKNPAAEAAPKDDSKKEDESAPAGEAKADDGKSKTRDARFVVAGDSDFMTNQYSNYFGNSDLFMNSVSWAIGEGDLISIRPKKKGEKPIDLPSESYSRFITNVPALLFPVLLVGLGVYIWARRRRL